MLKHILYWLLYWGWILIFISCNGFFLYRMVSGFVRVKEKWRFRVILFLLLGGTSGMVIWVGDNNLLLTMPVFAALYLLCTEGETLGRLATLTIFFCLIMSVCAIADTYLTFTDRYVGLANLVRIAAFGLLYAALKGRLPGEPVSLSRRLWKLVLGLTSMPFCVLVAVILLTYQRNESPDVDFLSMRQGLVTLPIVLLTSVVLLLAILTLADYEQLAREKQLASLREIYYQGIRREQTQVRTLRHDLRNHLTVLQDLIESGKTEKAEDYVKQILGAPALRGSRQPSRKEYYYGAKLHSIVIRRPVKLPVAETLMLSHASVFDLTAAKEIMCTAPLSHGGILLADKAYIDSSWEATLQSENNLKITTPRKKAKGDTLVSGDAYSTSVSMLRQPIESFFNWKEVRFHIQRASNVRSTVGLLSHVFASLAAAMFFLLFNS